MSVNCRTGQAFRAVGVTISPDVPWYRGANVDHPAGEVKGDPTAIAAAVTAQIFSLRHPGLRMGGG